jgi:hypothetical protein
MKARATPRTEDPVEHLLCCLDQTQVVAEL